MSKFIKHNPQFIKDIEMIRSTKRVWPDNAVETHLHGKTNRFVVVNSASLSERTENILKV